MSDAIFTVQQTLLIALEAHCAELTYGHCDFSAMVDSLAKRIELQGAKGKSWGCQKLIVVFILPFLSQLAPTRSLHVTLPASVRPCSRNGRCSTSVAPATHAATGQCLMSSTGPGPTQSTTVRGRYLYITDPLLYSSSSFKTRPFYSSNWHFNRCRSRIYWKDHDYKQTIIRKDRALCKKLDDTHSGL